MSETIQGRIVGQEAMKERLMFREHNMKRERRARGESKRGKRIDERAEEKLCQEPTGRKFQGRSGV